MTVPSSWLPTHRVSSANDSARAPAPVAYVSTTAPAELIWYTSPFRSSAVHTKPPPAAR